MRAECTQARSVMHGVMRRKGGASVPEMGGLPCSGTQSQAPRVCHLTSVHTLGDIRIFVKECATVAAAGYETTLVGLSPEPIEANGVRLVPAEKPTTRFRRWTRTVPWVFRQARLANADIYHLHDPELIPVGLALKALGRKVVYDAHEDYSATILRKGWIPRPLRRPSAAICGAAEVAAAHCLDGTVAVTDYVAKRFTTSAVTVVRNFPRVELYLSNPLPEFEASPTIVYAGAIALERGVFEMVRAMELVDSGHAARLVLAGPMSPPTILQELRACGGWSAVDYRGVLPYSEVPSLLQHAHVGLLPLHTTPNNVEGLPNKLFEYMAAGLPVIASRSLKSGGIVQAAQCGLLVDPLDASAIATAISWLLDHPDEAQEMGKRGREAVRDEFSWTGEGAALLGLYQRILS